MKVGIMQPYFFPYIGYWQLINAVDKFVIYDNVQFTKGGWFRRNRILMNGKDKMISLPVKKDSGYLNVNKRFLSDTFENDRRKIINQIKASYSKAPEFINVLPIVEKAMHHESSNLFSFTFASIKAIVDYLEIDTELIVSSSIEMNHSLKGKDRVIKICKKLEASKYINPIGGKDLYNKKDFQLAGVTLAFLKTNEIVYPQFQNEFIPNLSIIDVMMFNSKSTIKDMLNKFELV